MIRELHAANFEAYGYRKMHLALKRHGVQDVGRDRVRRLMHQDGIRGAKRRGKPWRTTTPDPNAARRPDLVERDFTATGPDRLYVADFTYLRCWEGMVFSAFVIDVYSRRVVGWQLAGHMRASLVCDALRMAVCTRHRHGVDVQLVHHSDRGSQYLGLDLAQVLDDHDVLQSEARTPGTRRSITAPTPTTRRPIATLASHLQPDGVHTATSPVSPNALAKRVFLFSHLKGRPTNDTATADGSRPAAETTDDGCPTDARQATEQPAQPPASAANDKGKRRPRACAFRLDGYRVIVAGPTCGDPRPKRQPPIRAAEQLSSAN